MENSKPDQLLGGFAATFGKRTQRRRKGKGGGGGVGVGILFRWPIPIINQVDKTKLSHSLIVLTLTKDDSRYTLDLEREEAKTLYFSYQDCTNKSHF